MYANGLIFRSQKGTLMAAALLGAAIVSYGFFPALAWLTPFIFGFGVLLVMMREASAGENRAILLLGCGAALVQLLVCLFMGYRQPGTNSLWKDDLQYFNQGIAIADAWRAGFFPELYMKGSSPYIGSLHTGYPRVLGFMFTIFGNSGPSGLLVNIICVALMPAIAFSFSRLLFEGTVRSRNADLAAAALTIAHPSMYYWGKWLMKDLLLGTLFLLCLVLILHAFRRKALWSMIGAMLMVLFLVTLRLYTAVAICGAVGALLLAKLPTRGLFWAAFYGALVVAVLSYGELAGAFLRQMAYSWGTLLPKQVQTVPGALVFLSRGIPRLVLTPYAWVRAFGERPIYGVYPGMWYLYLAIYPLSLAGLLRAVRENHVPSILSVTVLIASSFIFLTAYGGDVLRQRFYLELMLVPYAVYGWGEKYRRAVMVTWYVALLSYAIVQLTTLHMRY